MTQEPSPQTLRVAPSPEGEGESRARGRGRDWQPSCQKAGGRRRPMDRDKFRPPATAGQSGAKEGKAGRTPRVGQGLTRRSPVAPLLWEQGLGPGRPGHGEAVAT